MKKGRGIVLMSGGLDSQLAVRVLERAGAEVEGVCYSSPFFSPDKGIEAAKNLGLPLTVIDFTADEIALLHNPPHGFGGAMNPCIDCHAQMIRRAGELMQAKGFDFIATGEVLGQRPMSQNRQSLGVVAKISGHANRLIRPLSAKLLEPTQPEMDGLIDREQLLDISGRSRERQMALAAEFGITDYPSPAGGCKLTEASYGRRLKDLMTHEGLENRVLLDLLKVARRFRFPAGTGVILGRDQTENGILKGLAAQGTLVSPVNVPGPTALLTQIGSAEELEWALKLVCAYSRFDQLEGEIRVRIQGNGQTEECAVPRPYDREAFKPYQLT